MLYVKQCMPLIIFIASVFLFLHSSFADAAPRQAYLIMDADNGKILDSYNAHKYVYPASLTKIMTLYMVFDALERKRIALNSNFRVSKRASRMSPSKLWLKAGSYITVEHAIKALVTKSANDVAATVAENLGRSEANFAKMMTQKAKAIGMRNTVFRNASGLPHRKQVTTAKDMAVLAIRMLRDFPQYYNFFRAKSFRYKGKTYRNHNKLLRQYPGTDGIKTGFISASGYNLVSSVKRNGKRLVGVVFGGKTGNKRNAKMVKILNKGFNIVNKKSYQLRYASTQPTIQAPLKALAHYVKLSHNVQIANAISSTITKLSLSSAVKLDDVDIETGNLPPAPPKTMLSEIINKALDNPESWSIQIGAYRKDDHAHAQARRAVDLLVNKIKSLEYRIVPNQSNIHKVRLVNLSKQDAFKACRHLRKKNIDCFAIKPRTNI